MVAALEYEREFNLIPIGFSQTSVIPQGKEITMGRRVYKVTKPPGFLTPH